MFWLFLPTLAFAGYFSEHVEKYLNVTIDPCDDFYDHVCTASMAEDRLLKFDGPTRYRNLLEQLASPKIDAFRSLIRKETENDRTLIPQLPYESIAYERFGCEGSANANHFLEEFEAYDAHYRLQTSPYYNTLKNKITNIFTVLKDILIEEFTEAPWTRKHADLVNFLKNLSLNHLEVKPFPTEEYTDIMRSRYEECTSCKSAYCKTVEYSKSCAYKAICQIRQKMQQDISEYAEKAFHRGAWYNNTENYVILSPMFYTLEEEDLPYMIGSVDTVISHEIGHVFFNGKAVPANSECFRKHMKRTCSKYSNEEECQKYDKNEGGIPAANGNYSRLGDDASDWIGMYAGLKVFRKYFSEDSSIEGYSNSTEILKKFFYANAINWCSAAPKLGDEFHSPPKVRVNGIASLFPEFAEAFQCKRGSNMAKAATCLPFAGEGAPMRKRSRHM